MCCLHGYRQQRTDDHAKSTDSWNSRKYNCTQMALPTFASQIKTELPPAAQILCWLLQPLQKHESNKLWQGGGFFGVAGGNWGRLGASQQHRQPPAEPPTPDSIGPKDLSKPRHDIHLVEIKYCDDTRPQNQLNAAKVRHKDLCSISEEPPLLSTSSFWVWAAPSTTTTPTL